MHKVVLSIVALLASLVCHGSQIQFKAARAVWPEGLENEMNMFIGFRASFDSKAGEKPILRITGSSVYRITLNGEHVGYGPARTAKGFFRVDEIPLAPKDGRNVLAVEVAGYNCRSFYHLSQSVFLLAEVEQGGRILAATGRSGQFEAQRLPRVQKSPRYSFQRPFMEHYVLSAGFDDWKKGAGKFSKLALNELPEVKLLPRRAPYPDYSINKLKPVSAAKTEFDDKRGVRQAHFVNGASRPTINGFAVKDLAANWWELAQRYIAKDRKPVGGKCGPMRLCDGQSVIYDGGLNDTGFIGMRVVCHRPGTLMVKFDEILSGGEVSSTRYYCTNVVAWEIKEPGVYNLESFEPYTMRYIDVIATSGDFEVASPYFRTYKNPDTRGIAFDSSDPRLNKIFEAARETYIQNAVDVFTDCPGRERAGWLCDSFFTARASKLFTGKLDMEHLFLENYLLPEKFEFIPKGMFAMCFPSDVADGNFIPNWAMWLAVQLDEYAKRGGDEKIVAAYRPKLIALIDYLKTFRNSDGLLEKLPRWVFIEWSRSNGLVQDVSYPSNMTWAGVLEIVGRLYGIPEYIDEAAKVRQTILKQSWTGEWFCDNAIRQKDGTLKLSGECTETCQYYAFFFRTATPQTHPELWNTLLNDFGPSRGKTGKHPKIASSNAFIGNFLRLECLSREGHSAKILEETRDFFLYMADLTGTLWENTHHHASCNHGFASHVVVFLVRDMLGLRDIDYVSKTVRFDPPKNLELNRISMRVPVSGTEAIEASWEKKPDGSIRENIVLPDGWKRK